jgi:hypothetical protein
LVRSEIVNFGSGRSSRSRLTSGAACSGIAREPCQPSSRAARRKAGSEVPPIQIGIGFSGFGCIRIWSIVAGIQRASKLTGSSLHTAFIIRDALVGAPAALLERHAERGELGLHPADPGAEDEPAARQVLQRRQLLGERQRVAHRQHQDAGAEPDTLV